jgi:hypothetical protein
MTQTFLPIRTNYDFNKFVNLACQNFIFTMLFYMQNIPNLSQQNTVLARTKISGTRETKREKKWRQMGQRQYH